MRGDAEGSPRPVLSALDGAVLVVGVVLGVGIFRSPSVVASQTGDGLLFLGLWLVGGLISCVGALCYAELATAYPDAGGEYHILSRSLGPSVGLLVAWSRMTVIQTGSIAILAFVIGDYATDLFRLGEGAPAVIAATVVVVLTAVNVAGLRQGRWTQYALTGGAVTAVGAVVVAGLSLVGDPPATGSTSAPAASGDGSVGLALIFVLVAFGGWSEGAYVSEEIRDRSRGIGRALVWGTGTITLLYLLANGAYLAGLGIDGVAATDAVAADLLETALGPWGGRVVTGAVLFAALSSVNATVITGARSNYALGRDWPVFRRLGGWNPARQTPTSALLVQGGIALLLVGFGAVQRGGFEAMVAYTAPVYWLVLLLTGAAVIVLRRREPEADRPYRVPLYPLTPIVFCLAAGYLVVSSVRNAGDGALLGLAVVAAGLPFLWSEPPDAPSSRPDRRSSSPRSPENDPEWSR